jgi:hypothetical protein
LLHLLSGTGQFEPLEPIILHLAEPKKTDDYSEALNRSDVILAQKTAPQFPIPILRSKHIKETYGNKALVWPNIFFGGQQPYLRYFTHRTAGRILGPLEATHDLRIFMDWVVHRTGKQLWTPPPDALYQEEIIHRSLANLRQREQGCDIILSDVIESNLDQQLFFTFNHPSMQLLRTAAQRVLSNIMTDGPEIPAADFEPLAAVRGPSTWEAQSDSMLYRGREVELQPEGRIALTGRAEYKIEDLREAFFECYDHMAEIMDIESIRVTPNYPGAELDGPFSS